MGALKSMTMCGIPDALPQMKEAVFDADWLRLTLIPGIGGETQRKLLATFGLPAQIFSASYAALRGCIGDKAATRLLETDNQAAVAQALQWAEAADHHILCLADAAYPQRWLELPDPPNVVYVRGRRDLLQAPTIAIVGSRNATPQGEKNAHAFAAALAARGFAIVSGLALGIDAAAHRGALASQGGTLAVVGTGVDRLYPARHHALAHEIAARGTIISEFPLGTPALAANFPRRNRLISGLACGVLVVEAALESGSLITARLAADQGREVFAIPGSIHSPQARGCHQLIRQGAKLVETAQDVWEELTALVEDMPTPPSFKTEGGCEDSPLLQQIGFDPVGFDDLLARSGLTAEVLSTALLDLELAGHIAQLPGTRYQRL